MTNACSGRYHATLDALSSRTNSIGFLRFSLAVIVIFSHAFALGGYSLDPLRRLSNGATDIGHEAVEAFFVLSGFLITRSYQSASSTRRFLWHRFLRIFPAFWICLMLTAFVLAPIAFQREHGNLHGFLDGANGPYSYVARNALLQVNQATIWSILAQTPAKPQLMNGSLWTLSYEFVCYLIIAIIGIAGFVRRAPLAVVACSTLLLATYAALAYARGSLPETLGLSIMSLLICFFVGSCAYLVRNRIPLRADIAMLCAVVFVAAVPITAFAALSLLSLCYLVLYAAVTLPFAGFDRRMDLSYGIYIYGFPIQQLLTIYGLNKLGFPAYLSGAVAIALGLAFLSWIVVEKPALSLKGVGLRPLPDQAPGLRPISASLNADRLSTG